MADFRTDWRMIEAFESKILGTLELISITNSKFRNHTIFLCLKLENVLINGYGIFFFNPLELFWVRITWNKTLHQRINIFTENKTIKHILWYRMCNRNSEYSVILHRKLFKIIWIFQLFLDIPAPFWFQSFFF